MKIIVIILALYAICKLGIWALTRKTANVAIAQGENKLDQYALSVFNENKAFNASLTPEQRAGIEALKNK